jgi:cell division protein FtsB
MRNLSQNGLKFLLVERKQNLRQMNNKNNIIGILFLIIIGLFVYNIITTNQIKTDVKKYQTSIDSIQTKIDSVSILNKELDNKLAELDTNILEITQEIQLVDNNINVIKKKTNEKVASVDNLGNDELQHFFTDKYGK